MFWTYDRLCYNTLRTFWIFTIIPFLLTTHVSLYAYHQEIKFNLLNIDKEIKKLIKPIKSLNSFSTLDDIAKAAAIFKHELDAIYPTGISVNQAFDMCLAQLAQNGVNLKHSLLKPLIKRIKHFESKTLMKAFLKSNAESILKLKS